MAKEKAPNVVLSQFDAFKTMVPQKAIDSLAADQGITFGKPEKHVGFLSTGLLCFDLILEGGYAPGRFSYVYGDTGAGKSTEMFFTIKESMPRGCYVVFFDEETAVDTEYCAKIGISIGTVSGFRNKKGDWTECPQFVYRDNVTAEDTFKFMNQFMTKLLPDKVVLWDEDLGRHRAFLIPNGIKYRNDLHGLTSLVRTTADVKDESQRVVEVDDLGPQVVFLIDSLKAMPLEGKMENLDAAELPALRARVFGIYMDTIKGPLGQKRCILVATNHLTINPMAKFGNPESEPGGKAVQFYPDSKLKLRTNRAKSSIEVEPSVDGGTDRYIPGVAEVFKNKWGAPFRTTDYRLMIDHNGEPGDGFDLAFDCFNFLTMTKNIEQIGTQKDKRYKILFDGFPESLSYLEFKIMFLTTPDGERLKQVCRGLLESRKAFIQYAEYRQAEQAAPKQAKVSDPHGSKPKRSL